MNLINQIYSVGSMVFLWVRQQMEKKHPSSIRFKKKDGKRAWETSCWSTDDLNVSKNVTLTTGSVISGQQFQREKKVVPKTRTQFTHSLRGSLLCSLNTFTQNMWTLFQHNHLVDPGDLSGNLSESEFTTLSAEFLTGMNFNTETLQQGQG